MDGEQENLKARAARELHPAAHRHSAQMLSSIRVLNEQILAVEPACWPAALRLAEVHLHWAGLARDAAAIRHHLDRSRSWCEVVSSITGGAGTRDAVVSTEGTVAQRGNGCRGEKHNIWRFLGVMTIPDELVALSRSLRRDEPRRPHLASVVSRRAVHYADTGPPADPKCREERVRARASLAASLRSARRPSEARQVAQEILELEPGSLVGVTMLISATRDEAGGRAAVALVEDRRDIDWQAAERDGFLASALTAAYHDADNLDRAAHWAKCALRHDIEHEAIPRAELVERALHIAEVLNSRGEAELAATLREIARAAAATPAARSPGRPEMTS